MLAFNGYIIEVHKSIGAPTKVKLNISQLALVKLAQTGEHQTGMEKILSSTPTGGNIFFWTYFYYPFRANFAWIFKKIYSSTRFDKNNVRGKYNDWLIIYNVYQDSDIVRGSRLIVS